MIDWIKFEEELFNKINLQNNTNAANTKLVEIISGAATIALKQYHDMIIEAASECEK